MNTESQCAKRKYFIPKGTTYGRLTTTGQEMIRSKQFYYEVMCRCGNQKYIAGSSLRNGDSKSCGCLNIELTKKRSITHGLTKSREYKAWAGAKERVSNKNNHNWLNYGGRGIAMDKRWLDSFEVFFDYTSTHLGKHPGKGYSLDRIDNDGNYEPGNVRWADQKTQTLNSRHANMITFFGKTMSLKEWSKELDMNYRTLSSRINIYKWPLERALTNKLERTK